MKIGAAAILLAVLCGSALPDAWADESNPTCSPTIVEEGCGTFVWPDGTRYVGGFHGGFFDGKGVVIYSNGARLEMNFNSGSGGSNDAVYTAPDGTKLAGPFHDVSRDIAHPHAPLDYPFWRAFFGDQANVIVAAIVDKDGFIKTARLYQKIDSESFTKAAVEGVQGWRYLPATIGGQPIPMPYLIEIQFAKAD